MFTGYFVFCLLLSKYWVQHSFYTSSLQLLRAKVSKTDLKHSSCGLRTLWAWLVTICEVIILNYFFKFMHYCFILNIKI